MKELSIEEKAKAYDEALKVLHKYDGANIMFSQSLKEEMFPELAESEEEKIRKEIVRFIQMEVEDEIVGNKWLAWLEKQGKIVDYYEDRLDECACKYFNKGYKQALEKQAEQKPVDVRTTGYWQVKDVEQKPAWSIGDENLFKCAIDAIKQESKVRTDGCLDEEVGEKVINWLKSLKDRVQPQPKQEWSEEDETALDDALWCCKQAASIAKDENDMGNAWYAENWLKSLRPQKQWKKSLATADLENSLCDIQDRFSDTSYEYRTLGEAIEFIRCTEPKPQWKPSDKQIAALKDVRQGIFRLGILESLYQDLKKLRKE